MKLKTTNREIREKSFKIYAVGYCAAHELLSAFEPFAYTSGVNGWNADFYEIDGITLSTGYRPIGEAVAWQYLENYENAAKAIRRSDLYNWEEKTEEIKKLAFAFVAGLQKK